MLGSVLSAVTEKRLTSREGRLEENFDLYVEIETQLLLLTKRHLIN